MKQTSSKCLVHICCHARNTVFLFAGNYNANFRGLKRLYGNNVYLWLKNEFHRETEGVDCPGHMVHICLQAVVDVPPINFEVIVVKSLKYFYIYTLHITQFKSIEICHCWYHQDFKHENAGFISLQLLTEAVSISHMEARTESMEEKAMNLLCYQPN